MVVSRSLTCGCGICVEERREVMRRISSRRAVGSWFPCCLVDFEEWPLVSRLRRDVIIKSDFEVRIWHVLRVWQLC